jgi:hypothetical protein
MLEARSESAFQSHFYVSRTFDSAITNATSVKRRRCLKNDMVFALGVALLELSHGQPLISLRTPDDLNDQGMEDSMTELKTATRLANDIDKRETENYAKAVLRCVGCNFDTFTYDFGNREFKEKFFEGVVAPLTADYEYAIGEKH